MLAVQFFILPGNVILIISQFCLGVDCRGVRGFRDIESSHDSLSQVNAEVTTPFNDLLPCLSCFNSSLREDRKSGVLILSGASV